MRLTAKLGQYGRCPFCSSDYLQKAGWDYSARGKKQRYICHSCHRVTTLPSRQLELAEVKNETTDK